MKLRQYQIDAVELLRHGWKENKRQVLCVPTGGGKTVIFSSIVLEAAKRGTKTLVLTHRTELFEQTFRTIERHGISTQRIEAKNKDLDPECLVSVAMVETLERRIKKGFEFVPKLIIIDECHFGNFTKIIDYFPDSFVIGVTATPVGKHFHKYYTNIVEPIRLSELIAQGFLCDYRGFQMQNDLSNVKIKAGEFDEKSMFSAFDKSELYNGVVDSYLEKCNGKQAVVFNCNIEHSDKVAQMFNDRGILSYSLTSKTSTEDRQKILSDFSAKKFNVICNAGILTTGWDYPPLEVVVVNRATMSLPLWLQMCGRGSRTYEGKTHFTVLDFGRNHDRHGMWSDDRVWNLKPPEKKKEKAPPIKECPNCCAILAPRVVICEFCGHEFKADKKDLIDGVLVEVRRKQLEGMLVSELTIPELIILEKTRLKPAYVVRVARSRGAESLRLYAKIKGYKNGWVNWQLQNKDVEFKDLII